MDGSEQTSEHGFTLIELMVVVLILGILIAIAVPSFLQARDHAVMADLHTSVKAAVVVATDDAGELDQVDAAALQAEEGPLNFLDGTQLNYIAVTKPIGDNSIVFRRRSETGTWFAAVLHRTGTTAECRAGSGEDPTPAAVASLDGCDVAEDW